MGSEVQSGGTLCVKKETINIQTTSILSPSVLPSNGLVIGIICPEGMSMIEGMCVLPIANCKKYSRDSCLACNSGFSLQNNKCLMPSFCTDLDILEIVLLCLIILIVRKQMPQGNTILQSI